MRVFDAAAILLSLTVLFNGALQFLSADAALIAAGFLATEVTYLCMVALRWIRIYDTDFLIKATHGIVAASGVITFVGGAALLFTNTFLFPLIPGTALAWLGSMTVYFGVSRVLAGLWAKPLASSGAFPSFTSSLVCASRNTSASAMRPAAGGRESANHIARST